MPIKTNYERYLEHFENNRKTWTQLPTQSFIGIHPSQLVPKTPFSDPVFFSQCELADQMGINLFPENDIPFIDRKEPYKIKINREHV